MSADKITVNKFISKLQKLVLDGTISGDANVVVVRDDPPDLRPEFDGPSIIPMCAEERRDGWILKPDSPDAQWSGPTGFSTLERIVVLSAWDKETLTEDHAEKEKECR